MSIIRRIKRKNKQTGKDEVMDLGALGSNVVQDANHRFATDTEKTTWNGKVDASGGDISSTKVSTITDSSESFPVPAAGDQTKTWLGKIKKWQQDCLAKFGNYLLTSMIANQHQNNTGTVPSSALVYLMQQAILANQNSINGLNTNFTAIAGNGTSNPMVVEALYAASYRLLSGWCIVYFDVRIGEITDDDTIIISGIPESKINSYARIISNDGKTVLQFNVREYATTLQAAKGNAGRYSGSFVYPVK